MLFVWAQALEEATAGRHCFPEVLPVCFHPEGKILWEWLCDGSALHICIWSGSQDSGPFRLSGRCALVYAPCCQSALIHLKWIQEG